MKTILLISSLFIAAPAFAQAAPNPATNGGPVGATGPMNGSAMAPASGSDMTMPTTGMNPATNGGPVATPKAADNSAMPMSHDAMSKVPMCSRTVMDNCMQSGMHHARKRR